ncbi:MAG TPA: MarR family transcriptional regulator [Candidatus Pseudogracilibacillus intestinigallinarum]|uniref:MarR family transcriptional regulator n=1 Tax=Candidatus Pseudogracilibacillus intestinigallinarum TaxID=2838742 RepID=A0A9D1PLE5_9BACI|nr:MarR family transcriptional regulator [Candidatus Pseudogracilibacillus intestinigallinarum]
MEKNTLGTLIWLRMVRFTHQSNLLTNEFLKEDGLTSAQFDVLMQIATYAPISQTALAEKVTITQGGMSRMLARLEKEGYIIREQDWKTKMICLTNKGEQKLSSVMEKQIAFQSSFFEESLTKEEQKKLLQLVSKVQKNSNAKLQKKRG